MMKQVNMQLPLRLMTLLLGFFLTVGAFAQQITVRGHVKDAAGEPIIGATIRVAGSQTGVVSDFDGNFQIQADQGQTLQVTYVGYQVANVQVAPSVEVTLQDDSQVLDNVVVIGYGRAKKNDLTGSVTAIKPDEMNKGLITNAQDALQGKVAGVNIINSGGAPGGSATIRIRGGSSLNASNDPLIVIDGLAMDSYGIQGASNPLSMVNPADIESFTVLKDASATAIYGSRASNGVIIITTKKGQKNQKAKVSYSGNVSVSMNNNTVDMMDANEFMSYIQNRLGMDDATWQASQEYQRMGYFDAAGNHLFANTDWQDEIYRTAVSHDHNITVSGGLANMPYRVSLGYTGQQGVLKTSDYSRYTASVNLAPTFLDNHLTVNLNGKYMHSNTTYAQQSAIGYAVGMDPTKPVHADWDPYRTHYAGYWQWATPVTRDFDPTWIYGVENTAPKNPVAALNLYSDKGKSNVFLGNIELDYQVHGLEDLHIHMNGGIDVTSGKSNKNQSPYNYDTGLYYYGSYGWNTQDTYNMSFNIYAQYMKDFAEIHHLDVMAGYEWQDFHKKTDYFYCGYYPETAGLDNDGNALAGRQYEPSENTLYKTANYLVSFFGRLNYSLLDRYLVTFTLRDDGSSRFSKNNRWGLFPSVALAWKINEEGLFKNIDALSDLKLRLGWGITGQQEGIGDYTYFASYTPNLKGAYYPIVGDGITYRPDAYNDDLTWEKTTTWNAGLDFGFMNNRLTMALDWYYRKTTDLINTVFVPAGSNFAEKVNSNIGSLHNTGLEFSLNWRAIQTNDWRWELGYNVTWNQNEIDELIASSGDDYKITYGGRAVGTGSADGVKAWKVGQSASAYYVFQQVYDEFGQPIEGQFVDRNADGVINNDDRYFYKKSTPDVTMGLTSKLIYKNWDLGFSMRANLNNYNYFALEAGNSNLSISNLSIGGSWHNVMKMETEKNWQYVDGNDAMSDYFIRNASFLKLDNITLGYSFQRLFGTNISGRVYGTAQNVLTVTKYDGLDPEVDGGYDGTLYPRPFVGIFGLNLNF
ncbi:MAG: TonB-dependent receptor [Prevotella sp.]|nr:TonB-dependent receptor [Prevotella sp.]